MNYIFKNYFSKQLRRIIYVFILTSVLSLSTNLISQAGTATPKKLATAECGQAKDKVMNDQSDRTDGLPNSVANAVRQDLARKLNISADNLKIINYSQETWSDGCLGLAQADEFCTQALVEGWRVTLSNQRQTWVYRTDRQGQVIRLDQSNSANFSKSVPINNNNLKPIQIPTNQLPPPLQPNVVFRAIASGGITGRTYETSLLDDGLLIRVAINLNGTAFQTQKSQISQQQLQRFQ